MVVLDLHGYEGFSLVAMSGGCSLVALCGFSLRCPLLWSVGSRVLGLQQLWLPGSRAQAQQLWCTGLVAPPHVGSSQTRDQTLVPCIGRQIPNNCTTREVPESLFLIPLDICPEVGLLNHMVKFYLYFLGNLHTVFILVFFGRATQLVE